MRYTLLLIFISLSPLSSEETKYFTIELPKGYLLKTSKSGADYSVDVIEADKVIASIDVNTRSSDYLMCFCAPIEKYENITLNGQKSMRLHDKEGTTIGYTLKIRGETTSVSVHYSSGSTEKSDVLIKSFESIILKTKEMKMGLR